MTQLIKAVALALATRRLTHLIVDDKITEPLRDVLFHAFGSNYWLRYLLTCTRCTSVWSAIAVLLLSKRRATGAIVGVLALSEATIITDEVIEIARPRSLMG